MNGSTAITENCTPMSLAKYVRFLIGSFRVGEAQDGETLTSGLTALLGSYPEWVVRAVCDPRSGLPVTSKFFPTLFEVKCACDEKMRPLLDFERRKRLEKAAEAERAHPLTESERDRRKSVVAAWRERMALQMTANDKGEVKLDEMDVRKCRGEMRELVAEALEARMQRLAASSRSTPCAPLGSWRVSKPISDSEENAA